MKIPENYKKVDAPMTYKDGIKYLNTNFAGWINEIDLDVLKLNDARYCVLGQLFNSSVSLGATELASILFTNHKALFDTNSIFGSRNPDPTTASHNSVKHHTVNWKRAINAEKAKQAKEFTTTTVSPLVTVAANIVTKPQTEEDFLAEINKAKERLSRVKEDYEAFKTAQAKAAKAARANKLKVNLEGKYTVELSGYELGLLTAVLGQTSGQTVRSNLQREQAGDSEIVLETLRQAEGDSTEVVVKATNGLYNRLRDGFIQKIVE